MPRGTQLFRETYITSPFAWEAMSPRSTYHLGFRHKPPVGSPSLHLPACHWSKLEAEAGARHPLAGWESLMPAASRTVLIFYSFPLLMASSADFPFMAVIKVSF